MVYKCLTQAGLIFILTMLSFTRNDVWREDYTLWEDVVKKAPDNPRGLYNLALNLHVKNKLDEALLLLDKIIKLNKHNWFVMSEIGAIFADKGMFDKALNYHMEALKMSPENPDVLDFIGITYVKMDNADRAIEFFKQSLHIRQDSPSTHYYLATLYRDREPNIAIYHYERAVMLNPDYYEALIDLANLYDELGVEDKAYELYMRAITIYPDLPEGYYNFGVFYERKGIYSSAQNYYQKALSLMPEYKEAREALNRVKRLVHN